MLVVKRKADISAQVTTLQCNNARATFLLKYVKLLTISRWIMVGKSFALPKSRY